MPGGKRKPEDRAQVGESSPAKELKRESISGTEVTSSTLCTEVRPLIDLIDKLRAFNLDGDLSLPAVAVIGDQSAGKSSVLEAISGVQLPRGTGIVTRCPLEMRMKHSKKAGVWKGKISYRNKENIAREMEIDKPESVGKVVCEAQNEMTSGTSKDYISLEVTSSDVPDLTLIDLPGIARNAVKGQPEDIEKQIKDLIKHYIERRETIILTVLQSNIDIATCEAIKMAKAFDKTGRRTLGVLTKPDLIDKGSENEVMKILHNDEHHLSKGYIMVKCRGQAAIMEGQSLKEALEDEISFFRNHGHFGTLRPAQWGISTLSKRLSKELREHIKAVLPKLKKDVQTKLMATKKQLTTLGEDPPKTESEKRIKALMMVTNFNTVVDTCLVNGQQINDRKVPKKIQRLYCDVRSCFEALRNQAKDCAPDISDPEIRKEIEEKMRLARGKEFINFVGRFELVESYVKESIQKLEEPSLSCFKKVNDITGAALTDLASDSFGIFPGLNERAKIAIRKVKVQIQKDGKEEIEKYFKMEDIIYAQDTTYSSELSLLTKPAPLDTGSEIKFVTIPRINEHHLSKGASVSKSLAWGQKTISEDKDGVHYNSVDHALRSVRSYYQVATRRICDVVPMIIQYHVFRRQHEILQQELLTMAADAATLVHIEEDEDVAEERLQCKRRQERLQLAEQELDKVN